MQVYLVREKKTIESNAKSVRELLLELKLNPTTFLVSKNEELVSEKEQLDPNDSIKIIPVISGG